MRRRSNKVEILIRHGERAERLSLQRPVVVGREADADVQIHSPRVSRAHCRLQIEGDAVKLTDLGSSNGTWVRGQEVSQVLLQEGDSCYLGGQDVQVTVVPVEADASLLADPPIVSAVVVPFIV